ncbi:hypothetical protein L1887_18755 [Cichorium endivia]|nr:hypothetical protein L1887_18755 [Cichorium endivia]
MGGLGIIIVLSFLFTMMDTYMILGFLFTMTDIYMILGFLFTMMDTYMILGWHDARDPLLQSVRYQSTRF